MQRFFYDCWASIWDSNLLLGERIKGVIFVLLVISLVSFVAGATIDKFGDLERAQASRDVRSSWAAVLQTLSSWTRRVLAPFAPLAEYLPISAGASVIFSLLLGLLALERELRWAAAAATLPALLVLLQYVYLWAHKPSEEGDARPNSAAESPWEPREHEVQAAQARKAVENAYGARTLFIRYGFPGIVLVVEGLVLVFALVRPPSFLALDHWEIAYGAQFGALGAFSWVMLELGRRSFRRDVTSGIALWSIVTLALGPVLAGVLALIWTPKAPGASDWQLAAVYFYAGYAPRTVLAAVASAASQLLRVGPSPKVETRTTPLTKIRGISPQIEERLAEEGIENVETLATAEPFRLHRDTSFDLRTILWWVDEALLMMYVPQRWQILEEHGITGAIDLADLGSTRVPKSEELLGSLANHASMDIEEFRALSRRVRLDRHVNYVWWIYNVYGANGAQHPPGIGLEGDRTATS